MFLQTAMTAETHLKITMNRKSREAPDGPTGNAQAKNPVWERKKCFL
jgi:hypothetical protein